jgi:hypothetical protein
MLQHQFAQIERNQSGLQGFRVEPLDEGKIPVNLGSKNLNSGSL